MQALKIHPRHQSAVIILYLHAHLSVISHSFSIQMLEMNICFYAIVNDADKVFKLFFYIYYTKTERERDLKSHTYSIDPEEV